MDVPENQENSRENYIEDGMEQTTSILILHEYCLLEIFSHLKIEEVFRMEKVCVRFREISQRIYKTTRILNITELYDSFVTIPEAMIIMSRVGQYIHTLTAEECKITLKKNEIPRITPVFESEYNFDLKGDCLFTIEKDESFVFRKLIKANLRYCEVTDDELCSLLPVDQLKALDISYTETITGKCFKTLKNIIDLNISGTVYLDSELFREFCEATPNLRSLNLYYTFVVPAHLKAIAQNLINLESLELSNYYGGAKQKHFLGIADLPKLKQLTLNKAFLDYMTDSYYNRASLDYYLDSDEEMGHNSYEEMLHPYEEKELDFNFIDFSEFLLLVSHHNRLESLTIEGTGDSVKLSTINLALQNLTNLKVLVLSIGSHYWDYILENFTAKHKLQELHIGTRKIESHTLEMFIVRCPTIRLIDIFSCQSKLDFSFLNNICDCLSQRFHVLEIIVDKVHQKACEELIDGRVFKNLKLIFRVEDTEDF